MLAHNQHIAQLSLVGAGPGDPELLTIKAVKALNRADVVMYDALVDKTLLDHAPNAIKVFVGKRGGKQYLSQEDINELMVQNVLHHGHVVRLKGGDPFVFGRGHEEKEYAESFNIKVTVIPGITSAVSVPELQGIPVTRRGVSESFWVLTATNKKDELSNDLHLAAQSTATVVILMGTRKLNKITALYKQLGKGDEFIAVIQNGSQQNEKIALGQIGNIEKVVVEKEIGSPAVIIIGDVVKCHPQLLKSMAMKARMS
ncbi:MAG: uroporphyrin-III C-methyltransferase [Saprospiraceae bacterium]|jgi:uroporphyrin-III C-methyltransferase